MKRFWIQNILILSISLSAFVFSGCSIYMAANLPIERPPSGLYTGKSMVEVDGRYGFPVAVGTTVDGEYAEQIQFIDGVSIGWKTARWCIHSTLDALSYCLWEFIGTPIEWANKDYPIYVYYIIYDSEGNIIRAVDRNSPEGVEISKLPWTVPFITDLKVNKDNYARGNMNDGDSSL